MKINNISNAQSFGKVYAIAGSDAEIEKLKRKAFKAEGDLIVFDATDLYTDSPMTSGFCSGAAHNEESIAIFVTGKEDTDNVRAMRPGWDSLNAITQHIFYFYNLTQEGIKKPLHTITSQMKSIKKPKS